ncbi:hypothetical protein [Methylorubrum aminovorans]|uniref:hypothetical protein n=1 Tax=Methylorubrum aminovorans TaxID=269069 RepID=UPI003C2BEAD2
MASDKSLAAEIEAVRVDLKRGAISVPLAATTIGLLVLNDAETVVAALRAAEAAALAPTTPEGRTDRA